MPLPTTAPPSWPRGTRTSCFSRSTELDLAGWDVEALGFDAPDCLDTLVQDEVPEPPKDPLTKPGQLFGLGRHRLLCGDSTHAADLSRLMAGAKARMMFTDPPWNVGIGLDSNPRHRQRPGLANDDLPPEQFQAFLEGFISAARPHIEGDIYCVLGACEWPRLDATLRQQGYHWSATVIWVKDHFVLGRSKYHRRYEPIWYGWHEDRTPPSRRVATSTTCGRSRGRAPRRSTRP